MSASTTANSNLRSGLVRKSLEEDGASSLRPGLARAQRREDDPAALAKSEPASSVEEAATTTRSFASPILTPELRGVQLVSITEEELDTSILEREFPTVTIERLEASPSAKNVKGGGLVLIDDFAWRGAFDFLRFDEMMTTRSGSRPIGSIAIRGDDASGVAWEVLGRYQRFIARRNHASMTPVFDAILEAHARAFDIDIVANGNPLARADFEHTLDAWQWTLRLDAEVGLVPQLAALFHAVDHGAAQGKVDEWIEHRALDVASPPLANHHHNNNSGNGNPNNVACIQRGDRARALLSNIRGVREEDAERVRAIIAGVESREESDEARLVEDADSLSFLSLYSPRYADHFGLAQTRRKVTYTVNRLSPLAQEKLGLIRLRPDIARLRR